MKTRARAGARLTGSLSFRLGVALALVLAIGGVAVSLAAYAYGRSAAQQSYDRLLVGAANQIAGSLGLRDGEVIVDIPVSAFELLSLAPRDRVVYAVFDDRGRLVTGYDTVALPEGDGRFFSGSFAGEPARYVHVRRQIAERSFLGAVDVVVGQTTEARRELTQQITRNALLAVAVVGLVISGLAVLAVNSALRPLHRIERDFALRSSRDLTPVDVEVPQEIASLVAALNRFIGRIDRQLRVMRTLIADASHQLRTPIAALRAQAELAREATDAEDQLRIVEKIHERSRNLSRLTDQLLNHAMIIHRADSVDLAPVDLRVVASDAVDQFDQTLSGSERVVRIDLPEAPMVCDGDALSLVEACKNLINNATAYGKPPITVFVRDDGAALNIGVRDRGDGMAEGLWADAGKRFAKRSGVSSTSAGLGLSIVSAVAQAHGGRMTIRRPADDRFEVFLELPKVREAEP
ncbi:sensor histidine kinase N-terminal domain-containing protein [Mameliella sp. CS4]|uniref:sensor histidine kinase n=1 Tax=Mameliella sp. CS4 TaxID=2862329 RepID=UPI001C604CC5|nr:sensor histidine kinase [Mameliella sp. CS4]MBW4985363.1 sensor histidine kinase N-terminal domain-containing protein [Mameliella sp. CS4]